MSLWFCSQCQAECQRNYHSYAGSFSLQLHMISLLIRTSLGFHRCSMKHVTGEMKGHDELKQDTRRIVS